MVDLPETIALQGVAVAFAGNSDGSRDDSQSFTMLVLGDNQVGEWWERPLPRAVAFYDSAAHNKEGR